VQPGVRHPQSRLLDPGRSVEQEVEIERPRALRRRPRPLPAEAPLDVQEELEEVWVWDKNRPTRMIPRAEILVTTGDVTIEELRGEGDEPVLTPEALAERIGEARSQEEDF